MMLNSALSGIDITFLIINMLGIFYAAYWNMRALKEGTFKSTPIAVLVLLAIYFAGYIFLIFSDVAPADWSSFFRGISPLAWVYVWAGPPKTWIESHFTVKKQAEHLEERVTKTIDTIVGRIDSGKKDDE